MLRQTAALNNLNFTVVTEVLLLTTVANVSEMSEGVSFGLIFHAKFEVPS